MANFVTVPKFRPLKTGAEGGLDPFAAGPLPRSCAEEADQIVAGAGPDVVRLSVGLEHIDDLIADLDQALAGL